MLYQIKTLKKMETIYSKKIGAGQWVISAEVNNRILSTTTTNSMAIDCAFDNDYDFCDGFYESQDQAKLALLNQIIRDNE